MSQRDALMQEQMRFLSQDNDRLAALRGRALYETLEGLDLTHGQFFRALDTSLDDYCAKEFGVDLQRITVERFFHSDPDAKWLFPEVVREAVLAGLRRKPRYPELIVRDERISGPVYDMPYVNEDPDEEELRSVAEGAAIPESVIRYGDRVVRLDKKGRGVIASYEVIRRMSVDMLRVHMRRMGERLGRNLDARLTEVLVSGDGSGETEPEEFNSHASGNWQYADLVLGHLALLLQNHFTPTHILAGPLTTGTVLTLEHPAANTPLFDFAKTGAFPTPLGMKLVPMSSHPETKMTFMDAGYAVQKLTEQELLLENDKLINQQWDRAYMTIVTDFAIVYEKARIVVKNNW
ncbi:MAG TPA: hypothetical protein ENN29_03355 [Candidatus Hydrogenedentes bacterium]|nr:hypothetical protein [Candidatus Hydrogenedentota bacterium]